MASGVARVGAWLPSAGCLPPPPRLDRTTDAVRPREIDGRRPPAAHLSLLIKPASSLTLSGPIDNVTMSK